MFLCSEWAFYSLSVINNPNLSGFAAMNFSLNAQNLGTGHTGGLVTRPVNEYVRRYHIVFASTVNCQNVNFAPVLPTSSLDARPHRILR